jgi:hypothetical protein
VAVLVAEVAVAVAVLDDAVVVVGTALPEDFTPYVMPVLGQLLEEPTYSAGIQVPVWKLPLTL